MASTEELIQQRRKELQDLGYRPGVVELALQWAGQSAEGSAAYFEQPSVLFLPRYLRDTEKYLKGLGVDNGNLDLDTARLTPGARGLDSPGGSTP